MQWRILKEIQRRAQKSNIYSWYNNINVNRVFSTMRYSGFPHNRWNNIYSMFCTSNWTVIDRTKIFSHTNITETNRFTCNKRFNRFTNDQGTARSTANTVTNSPTNTVVTSVKRLVNIRKIKGLFQLTVSPDYSFNTYKFTCRKNNVTTTCLA